MCDILLCLFTSQFSAEYGGDLRFTVASPGHHQARTMSSGLDIQTVPAGARDVAFDLSAAAVIAFESRCVLTKGECEGLHNSACRSRLSSGECMNNAMTVLDCLEDDCGSVQDFSNPAGESVDAVFFDCNSARP